MNDHADGDKVLRIGVVGCGKMSKNHAKAVQVADNAEIVAVCDNAISPDSVPDWFPEGVAFHAEIEDMLAGSQLDAVHIITPPNTHFPLAKSILERGISVLIEKPFVETSAQASLLFDLAKVHNAKLSAGHQLLYTRASKGIMENLDDIGDVKHIESFFSFRSVRRGISATDQLVDILPHPTCLLENFLRRSSREVDPIIQIAHVSATREGEVHAVVTCGDICGSVVVSLSGRPVDSYVKLVGTNGSLYGDFVQNFVVKTVGPGSSIFSMLLIPFVKSWQVFWKNVGAIFRLFSDRKKGYPGLPELVATFYDDIRSDTKATSTETSILNTVSICEAIEKVARNAESEFERIASDLKAEEELKLTPVDSEERGRVLLTGGTGLFGRPTAALLRNHGYAVTVISRSVPPMSKQLPGVDYIAIDLANPLPEDLLDGVDAVIHAAAETNGGFPEQEKNSIRATRQLLEASQASNVKRFVHISSIAVLKPRPSRGAALDETSPVDIGNRGRGPYVWGKAESEKVATDFAVNTDLPVRIVRLGPLVDFTNYTPPGRLGRDIHNLFVAMGSARDTLSICSVQTAAETMLTYMTHFEDMPRMLNLVEPQAPTRKELVQRWKEERNPMYVVRVPNLVLSGLSSVLVVLQRIFRRGAKPIDVKSAFSSEKYNAELAQSILEQGRKH